VNHLSEANSNETPGNPVGPIPDRVGLTLGQSLGPTLPTPRPTSARESSIGSSNCDFGLAVPSADPAHSTSVVAGVGAVRSSPIAIRSPLAREARAQQSGVREGTVLSDRDRAVLKVCMEQSFLTKEHIRHFFWNTAERRINRRLKILCDSQLLKRENYPEFGVQPIYRLTDRGREIARVSGAREIRDPGALNPTTLLHDALVTSCRLRLREFWNGEFVPERAIKIREFPEIPDGLFFFPTGHGIAIEIEHSDKGRTRFLRLLERWKETPSIVFILYVAANEKLFTALKRYLQDAPDDQPCGVVLWSELKTGHPLIHSPKGELDLLGQKEF